MKPPGQNEIVGIVVAVVALVIVLKVARVAIRLMFFLIGIMLLIGVFYFAFVR
jgi:hypothetical protein